MKRFYKTVIIIALVLIFLGLLLSTAAAACGGFMLLRSQGGAVYGVLNWAQQNLDRHFHIETPMPNEDVYTVDTVAVTGLELELGAGEFELCTGSGFSIRSEQGSLQGVGSEMVNGCWKITAGFDAVGIVQDTGKLIITVPEQVVLNDLDLELGAGSMTVKGINASHADIEVGAGRITLTDCVMKNAEFECGMGELSYTGDLSGDCGIKCGMGSASLQVNGLDTAEFGFSVQCGVGEVLILQQRYSVLGAEIVHDAHLADFFEIECGMGSVSLQAA